MLCQKDQVIMVHQYEEWTIEVFNQAPGLYNAVCTRVDEDNSIRSFNREGGSEAIALAKAIDSIDSIHIAVVRQRVIDSESQN